MSIYFQQFDKAAGDVKKLKSLPSDADLLELYALFKQATVGDSDPSSEYTVYPFIRNYLYSRCPREILIRGAIL